MNGLHVNGPFMKKVSAYVEQEDAFIGSLTVREHLRFMVCCCCCLPVYLFVYSPQALLRMGKRYSTKEQHRRVEIVMKEVT